MVSGRDEYASRFLALVEEGPVSKPTPSGTPIDYNWFIQKGYKPEMVGRIRNSLEGNLPFRAASFGYQILSEQELFRTVRGGKVKRGRHHLGHHPGVGRESVKAIEDYLRAHNYRF